MGARQLSTALKVGQQASTGQVVKEILGQSSSAAVYITEDGHLRWSFFDNEGSLSSNQKSVIGEFDGLMRDIKTYVPQSHCEDQLKLLGKALFRALEEDGAPSHDPFGEVKLAIEELAQQKVRLIYVSSCVISVGVILASFLSIKSTVEFQEPWVLFSTAGLLGAVGACLSVLNRIRRLEIDWKGSKEIIALEGIARIAVGMFFGVLFCLMCMGDLVLGAFKDNSPALFVFATISGFSERFIPELMEKLEARAGKSARG